MAVKKVPTLNFAEKVLEWWEGNQQFFPLLAEVAKEVFCVTAGSGALERDYCLPKHIYTFLKTNL